MTIKDTSNKPARVTTRKAEEQQPLTTTVADVTGSPMANAFAEAMATAIPMTAETRIHVMSVAEAEETQSEDAATAIEPSEKLLKIMKQLKTAAKGLRNVKKTIRENDAAVERAETFTDRAIRPCLVPGLKYERECFEDEITELFARAVKEMFKSHPRQSEVKAAFGEDFNAIVKAIGQVTAMRCLGKADKAEKKLAKLDQKVRTIATMLAAEFGMALRISAEPTAEEETKPETTKV